MRLHGNWTVRMVLPDDAVVHLLWSRIRRRSHTVSGGHSLVLVLRGDIWNPGGRGDSGAGVGDSGSRAIRFPAGVPAFRPDLPDRKHTGRTAVAIQHRVR